MAICHNKKYEAMFVRLMNKLNFPCFRVAGSGAAEEAVCDCILFLPEPCLVEVKATKENVFYMRKNVREQLEKMIDVCSSNNLIPVLAVKFKHRGWNIIKIKDYDNFKFDKKKVEYENLREDIVGVDGFSEKH